VLRLEGRLLVPVEAIAVLGEQRQRQLLPQPHATEVAHLELVRRDEQRVPVVSGQQAAWCPTRQIEVVPRTLGLEPLQREVHRLPVDEREVLWPEHTRGLRGHIPPAARLATRRHRLDLRIPVDEDRVLHKLFGHLAEDGLGSVSLELDALPQLDGAQLRLTQAAHHGQHDLDALLVGRQPLGLEILAELPHVVGPHTEDVQRLELVQPVRRLHPCHASTALEPVPVPLETHPAAEELDDL